MKYLRQEFEFADFMIEKSINPSDERKVFNYIGKDLEFTQGFAFIGTFKAINDNKLTVLHDGITSTFNLSNEVIDFIVNEQLLSDSIKKDDEGGNKIKLYVKTSDGIVIDMVALNTGASERTIHDRWYAEYCLVVRSTLNSTVEEDF